MEIEMKVLQEQSEFNPRHLDRLRRAINVLCDIGFDVNLSFKNGNKYDDKDENSRPYMGGRYPHQGYFMRMVKDTNRKLDMPVLK